MAYSFALAITRAYRLKSIAGLFFLAAVLNITSSCKKERPVLSSDKYITLFTFSTTSDPGAFVETSTSADSVKIAVSPGMSITSLVPTVAFVGKSISPTATVAENFTNPVKYTVTAQDGSTHTYVVVVRYLSATKSITSFVFKAADNPGVLTKDVVAKIQNDSIIALVPPGTDASRLVPDIVYSSHAMSPATKTAQDFNGTVSYTVTGEDLSNAVYKVFTGSPGSVYFGDSAGYVYSLDAVTGRVKWKYQTGAGIGASPTVYKGMLIVGSYDSHAYALDTAKGNLIWKAQLDGPVNETPDVANDMVYISGSSLYALDANTGNQVWEVGGRGYISVTVSGGRAFVKDALQNELFAYDALTGAPVWDSATDGLGDSNPAVANGLVYSQTEAAFMDAVLTTTRGRIWSFNTPGVRSSIFCDPTVSDGIVYFCTSSVDDPTNGIYALDAATGTQKWFYPGGYHRSPVVQNGSMWVTEGSHIGIIILDSKTGTEKDSFHLSTQGNIDPFVANGALYESDAANNFYAYNPFHGGLKWQFAAAGTISAPPLVIDANGTVTHPGSSGEQN